MNKLKISMILALSFACFACNDDEVFEKEQYKNVFALISGSSNVSTWYHDLRAPESTGYICASMGGSNASSKEVTATLVEDPTLIRAYNITNFDVDQTRYVHALAPNHYALTANTLTIPAGEVKGLIPVTVRPLGLSPDSLYFIALRVDTYNNYEVNPEKDYVLYEVRIKNWWAQYGGTAYNMRIMQSEIGSSTTLELPGSKKVFPLTGDKIRILAGSEMNDANSANVYNFYSLAITIGRDDKVKIESYKDPGLNVKQIDGDELYPNTATLFDDGYRLYKTLLLHYSYKGSDGKEYEIREELTLEWREDPEDPRYLD